MTKVKSKKREGDKKRNSVVAIQQWLKGPPALTKEEADLLEQIIMRAREGKVIPPEMLKANDAHEPWAGSTP